MPISNFCKCRERMERDRVRDSQKITIGNHNSRKGDEALKLSSTQENDEGQEKICDPEITPTPCINFLILLPAHLRIF